MRTSLDVTHHGTLDYLPLFLTKDLLFLFLVFFGKICTPIFLNVVLITIISIFYVLSRNFAAQIAQKTEALSNICLRQMIMFEIGVLLGYSLVYQK